MISNTVGHFGSCYRTPRADSALCGANRSDLGKRRAGDGSSKGRRTFFLQRWARAWLGARPGRLGTVQCPGVQISDMSSLNDDGSTFEKKRQDEKRLVWCCEWYLPKSHLGRGKPGSAASYWVKRRIIFTPKQGRDTEQEAEPGWAKNLEPWLRSQARIVIIPESSHALREAEPRLGEVVSPALPAAHVKRKIVCSGHRRLQEVQSTEEEAPRAVHRLRECCHVPFHSSSHSIPWARKQASAQDKPGQRIMWHAHLGDPSRCFPRQMWI